MNKKLLVLLSTIVALNSYANDNDDIKFIYKLYQNKEYKVSADELEKFILKYPSSKYYQDAQTLLGQSFYQIKEYEKAKKIFLKLTSNSANNEADLYLALISIELGKNDEAYKYSQNLKDANREKVLYALAFKEYSNNNLSKAKDYFEELRRIKGVYRSSALFNLGLITYNTGTYLEATIYLSEFLNTEKDDIERLATANYMLAFSYDKLNNKKAALDYYESIEKNYPNSSYYNLAIRDLLFYWTSKGDNGQISSYTEKLTGTQFSEYALQSTGSYYYNLKDYKKAIYYYEKALKTSDNSDIVFYLANSYLNIGDSKTALSLFKKLEKVEKYKNEYYYYLAYVYFKDEKYKDVITLLDGIEKKIDKDYSKYYQFIADSAYKIEDYSKAKKYYELIFNDKKTKDDFYKYYLVTSLTGDVKGTKVLYDYYRANFLKDRVYNESVYLIMGNLYVKQNDDVNGEIVYQDGIKNEFSEQLLENLIIVQIRLNKLEDAYKNIGKLDSTDNREYTRGTLLMGMKKYSEAVNNFEKIIDTGGNKEIVEKTFVKLAEAYLLEKNFNSTINTADRFEKMGYPFNKDIMDYKALAYFRLGNFDKARAIYEKNLESDKNKGNGYYMIAETYYNEKNYAGAKEFYKKSYAASNDSKIKKDSAYWLIRIEEVLGNEKELLDRIKAFRDIYPNSEYEEDITYLVAQIYEKSAERQGAINEYAKLYELSNSNTIKDEMAKRITELYYNDKDIKNAYAWSNKVSEEGYRILWQAYLMELEGKTADAIKSYEKIAKDKNYGDSANYKLGTYYLEKNDYKTSRTYFEKVLEFPASINNERAQYNIGITYEKEKDYMKAISSFLRIKLLLEDSAIEDLVLIKLGENYEKLNDRNKSYEYYKEYYRKYPNKQDYSYVVEKLLINRLEENSLNDAKLYYAELVRINPAAAKQYAEYLK